MRVPQIHPTFFDCRGFFEDFWITGKHLGSRGVEWPNRPFGAAGEIEVLITEPLELRRGLKPVTIKASKANPVRAYARLNILCGRTLQVGDVVEVRRTKAEHAVAVHPMAGRIAKLCEDGSVELTNGIATWREAEAWRLTIIAMPKDEIEA